MLFFSCVFISSVSFLEGFVFGILLKAYMWMLLFFVFLGFGKGMCGWEFGW